MERLSKHFIVTVDADINEFDIMSALMDRMISCEIDFVELKVTKEEETIETKIN